MGYDYRKLLKKRKALYLTPQEFLKEAAEYFVWCEEHPIMEEELWHNKGVIVRDEKEKVRPFTKKGLALFLGMSERRLNTLLKREDPEWQEATSLVEDVIYTQKFENAAAGLLNAGIITRDLGLAEKQEIGGIKDAPPVSFNINPIASGTFLPPEAAPAPTEEKE